MRFKLWLNEQSMTVEEALELLNLNREDLGDKPTIKKAYSKMAKKHHPDVGGTKEMMQKINTAYDILVKSKTSTGTGKPRENWKERQAKERALAKFIKEDLVSKFKPEKFVKHLNKITGLDFSYEIKEYPEESNKFPSFAGFKATFTSKDENTMFLFDVGTTLSSINISNALSFEDISYSVVINAHGLHNSKKQKLAQRDWDITQDHSILTSPSKVFPKAKLNKIISGQTSKRAFKKRDMLTFLRDKLDARIEDDKARIPIGDNYTLLLIRNVFMRSPAWLVNGYYKFSRIHQGPVVTLMENENTAKMLKELQDKLMRIDDIDRKAKVGNKIIKDFFEKQKGE